MSIAPHAETISPLLLGNQKDVDDLDLDRGGPRQHIAKGPGSKRLSGRRSHNPSISSMQSILGSGDGQVDDDARPSSSEQHHMFSGGLVGQVTAWVREERTKRAARKAKRKAATNARQAEADTKADDVDELERSSSNDSIDLSRLEQILKESLHVEKTARRQNSTTSHRKRPSVKSLHKSSNAGVSSDTD